MINTSIIVLKNSFNGNSVIQLEFLFFKNFSFFKKYIEENDVYFKKNNFTFSDEISIYNTFFSFENDSKEKITFEIFFSPLKWESNKKFYLLHIQQELDKEGIYDSVFIFEDKILAKKEFEKQKLSFLSRFSPENHTLGTLDDTESYYGFVKDDDYFHLNIFKLNTA